MYDQKNRQHTGKHPKSKIDRIFFFNFFFKRTDCIETKKSNALCPEGLNRWSGKCRGNRPFYPHKKGHEKLKKLISNSISAQSPGTVHADSLLCHHYSLYPLLAQLNTDVLFPFLTLFSFIFRWTVTSCTFVYMFTSRFSGNLFLKCTKSGWVNWSKTTHALPIAYIFFSRCM